MKAKDRQEQSSFSEKQRCFFTLLLRWWKSLLKRLPQEGKMKEAKKKAIAEFPRRLRFVPPLRHIPRAASAPPSPSGSPALPPHCFPGVPGAHAQPPPPPGSRESRGGKPKSPGRLAFQQPLFLAGLGTGEGGWPVPGGFPWGLEASARLLVKGGGPGRPVLKIKTKQ